jgi:hypothetical protein
MAKKVLKTNNEKANALKKKNALLGKVPEKKTEVKAKGKNKDLSKKYDFDLSSVRESVERNTDSRFITFFMTDKNTGEDVKCCEHKDYINPDLRKALQKAGLL